MLSLFVSLCLSYLTLAKEARFIVFQKISWKVLSIGDQERGKSQLPLRKAGALRASAFPSVRLSSRRSPEFGNEMELEFGNEVILGHLTLFPPTQHSASPCGKGNHHHADPCQGGPFPCDVRRDAENDQRDGRKSRDDTGEAVACGAHGLGRCKQAFFKRLNQRRWRLR